MRLLLDLGNTRLKWAYAELDGSLSAMQALVHHADSRCWDALLTDLKQFSPAAITQIALSSVAGARAQVLCDLLRQYLPDRPILQARSMASFAGVTSAYHVPAALGVDRFLALIAAHQHAGSNPNTGTQIIAMLGTAMTIDVLHAGGLHAGGLITPGPSLMQASLHTGTAELPLITGNTFALGRSTADAIHSGCQLACAALINSVVHDFPGARLLISGGAADDIMPLLRIRATFKPELVPKLVLEGLQRYSLKYEQID